MLDLQSLVVYSTVYLLALFLCAWATEKGFVPKSLVQHPLIYVLSLGVYASSWAYYGSIGIAHESGYIFLAFYFGLSAAFLLAPVLLSPILKIIKSNQLSSLADLFAFRFRSPAAGVLSTLLLLITVMPLLALQIQAVSDSILIISSESSPETLAIVFCVLMMLFTVLFGTRHIISRDQHQGLVFTIAIESLLKLIIMLVLGGVALFHVLGGPSGVEQWLKVNGNNFIGMRDSLENGPWRTTLLMFFASAIVMPHMFHMTFTENNNSRALHVASWGLPLFLLFLSISTPLILWAAIKLGVDTAPEYFPLALGLALNNPWLTIIGYLGGLSAASGLIIVTTLALSSMMLNHLVLPWYQPTAKAQLQVNIYQRLIWLKRLLIIALIVAAYAFYRFLHDDRDLYSLSIVAYVGALQLLPGALCTLYWDKGNNKGFIAGLLMGATGWFLMLMMPLSLEPLLPFSDGVYNKIFIMDNWNIAAMGSLAINIIVFYIVSSLTQSREAEVRVAKACLVQNVKLGVHNIPHAHSAIEFQKKLSIPLGLEAAQKEVSRALVDIGMKADNCHPHALARLRDKLEINLSGLMGPTVAHEIISTCLPTDSDKKFVTQDFHFLETRLEAYHSELTGLSAELDSLRRYHRDTLNSIPLGVCAIGSNNITLWNYALTQMTNVDASRVLGAPLDRIPQPWSKFLNDFMTSDTDYLGKHHIEVNGLPRFFSLHKARIDVAILGSEGSQVMLMEDVTENQMLEEQLIHSERLASIGQLAAGVAHEIGNPITGIDCLAQELKALSSEPDVKDTAQQILAQTKRVTSIVQMLVSYAHSGQLRQNSEQLAPVAVQDCVNEAISLLKLSKKNDSLKFQNNCPAEHKIMGNYQKFQQVFINLLSNAVDASDSGGEITVISKIMEHSINIEVEDNGHGISKDVQEKLFNPFFTTKEAGKGTGLGLALAWNLIEEYCGTIRVISPTKESCKRGSCFIISLPIMED
ncbi:MAG: ATP-binding protein [Candidatus Endonucleobacter sp. (ex Gigantidas childressi)]|nr:ATP-binding protein [Candidatus Endonucleobacter sp. (ex Gigantidas childressi)]